MFTHVRHECFFVLRNMYNRDIEKLRGGDWMDSWYRIDNTGKIFHAVSNTDNSYVFRVSMLMRETVDPEILQDALDVISSRFPTLNVRLRKGIFCDYIDNYAEVQLVMIYMI